MNNFATKKIDQLLTLSGDNKWLVKDLWPNLGVGILSAEPKCGKTWVALDIAVSVSTGTPVMNTFTVPQAGKVLFFNGEDAEHIQKERMDNILRAKGLKSAPNLEIIVTSDSIYIDKDEDLAKLRQTIIEHKPVLLILDPLVRMHQSNENSSADMKNVLSRLRSLQKEFKLAIILVHHSSKAGFKSKRGGQLMRGSSELHAWGDANLYLSKDRLENVTMDIELRSAVSVTDVPLKLEKINNGVCFKVIEQAVKTETQNIVIHKVIKESDQSTVIFDCNGTTEMLSVDEFIRWKFEGESPSKQEIDELKNQLNEFIE